MAERLCAVGACDAFFRQARRCVSDHAGTSISDIARIQPKNHSRALKELAATLIKHIRQWERSTNRNSDEYS
jgi:hypothetical protein